jgi:outer membrane protein assembly factor BamB
MVFYTIARTPNKDSGILVALNTATGETVWTLDMAAYTWSSPVALYTAKGTAYLVVCDTNGNAMLLDGATGTVHDKVNLGGLIEASPVAYENMLVVGTKAKKICGMKGS